MYSNKYKEPVYRKKSKYLARSVVIARSARWPPYTPLETPPIDVNVDNPRATTVQLLSVRETALNTAIRGFLRPLKTPTDVIRSPLSTAFRGSCGPPGVYLMGSGADG